MNLLNMPSCRTRVIARCLTLLLCALPVTAVVAGGDEAENVEVTGHVEIWLDDWRDDLPPGVSLIVKGGRLINRSFPAVSADRSLIAVLYYAGDPMAEGYPTLDLYSTASLALRERIAFLDEQETLRYASNLKDSAVLVRLGQRLQEANRYLAQGGFTPVPLLFELPWNEPANTIENMGKHLFFDRHVEPPVLTITSIETGRIDANVQMPQISLPASPFIDPEEFCGAQGFPVQGWYESGLSIVVLRLIFPSARDGCDQPEQWLFKRL